MRPVRPGRAALARQRGFAPRADDVRPAADRGRGRWRCWGASAEAAVRWRPDEHWDGSGKPEGMTGEEIPMLARIAGLAQTAEIFYATDGWAAAAEVVRARRGRWFDPRGRRLPVDRRRRPALAADEGRGRDRGGPGRRPRRHPGDGRRGPARPHRRGLRRRHRRQVALHRPPLDARRALRRGHRRASRPRPGGAPHAAPGGPAARRGQARALQRDPRQAGAAHGRRVRAGAHASALQPTDPVGNGRLRRHRRAGRVAPRAPRRQGLPPGPGRTGPLPPHPLPHGGGRLQGPDRRPTPTGGRWRSPTP